MSLFASSSRRWGGSTARRVGQGPWCADRGMCASRGRRPEWFSGLGAGLSSFGPIIGTSAGGRFEFLEFTGFDVFLAPHAALGSGAGPASCGCWARRTLADWSMFGMHSFGTDRRCTVPPCLSAHLVLYTCQGKAIRSRHRIGMSMPTGFVFIRTVHMGGKAARRFVSRTTDLRRCNRFRCRSRWRF